MRTTRTNLYLLPLLLLAGTSLFHAGCNKGETPGQQPVQKATATKIVKPVQKQESSARPIVKAPTALDFSKMRDPFKPLAVATPTAKTVAIKSRKIGNLPIHNFDVTQFKVIGIITGLKENRAMIVDPNGKPYVIKVGMTVGLNEGHVIRITNTAIEISEQFIDDSGKSRKQLIKLNLPRKQENM